MKTSKAVDRASAPNRTTGVDVRKGKRDERSPGTRGRLVVPLRNGLPGNSSPYYDHPYDSDCGCGAYEGQYT